MLLRLLSHLSCKQRKDAGVRLLEIFISLFILRLLLLLLLRCSLLDDLRWLQYEPILLTVVADLSLKVKFLVVANVFDWRHSIVAIYQNSWRQ